MSKLVDLRKTANLTQQALADKVGINIRQVQKFESGERSLQNITLKNAVAIAAALSVDVKELLK